MKKNLQFHLPFIFRLYKLRKKNLLLNQFLLVLMLFVGNNYIQAQCGGLGAAEVGGKVWEDWNYDGLTNETPETGVSNVSVSVYGCDGVLLGSLSTDANGEWSLNVAAAATCNGMNKVRVEYSGLPSGLKPSAVGTQNGSSVQFVSQGGCAMFAVGDPGMYFQPDPDFITPRFQNGLPNATHPALVKFAYGSDGIGVAGVITGVTDLALDSQIGACFGIAYARETKKIYSAALLRRHVGLIEGLPGNPLSRIFVTDDAGVATSQFINLETYGAVVGAVSTNAARGLGAYTAPSHDDDAYTKVGKVGLGDIDISDDGRFLYVTSLNDKKLFIIEIDADNNPATAPVLADVSNVAIPDPGCVNGEWRPFGLKYYRGDVYVGGVCNGINNSTMAGPRDVNTDMRFYVYKYDGAAFTTVINEDLDYPKGSTITTLADFNQWFSWNDGITFDHRSHPQPILSDIEFDGYGAMVLGFLDRFGLQRAHQNYPYNTAGTAPEMVLGGDILRFEKNGAGVFVMESNGVSGGLNGAAPGNNQGPGNGEFFDDNFEQAPGDIGHPEISYGALAIHPSNEHVIMNAMDPVNRDNVGMSAGYWFRAGGIRVLNANNGNYIRGFHVYRTGDYNASGMGKAQGLGDLEMLGDPAPIEIGNLVWEDKDTDGVQDAGETGISGITVELIKAGTVIATATTDASGNYIFSSKSSGTTTASHRYGLTMLVANMEYTVRIPNVTGGLKQNLLLSNILTSSNTGEGGNTDLNDSDGIIDIATGLHADVTVLASNIPSSGVSNHTFDFGFRCPAARCGTVSGVKN